MSFMHMEKAHRRIQRGDYLFPHQAQVLGRDLHGERIARNFGALADAYRLTAEQVEDRRLGRGPNHGLPYEFLIYTPGRGYTNWTAFYTRRDLVAFCHAYDLAMEPEIPGEGERFKLRLPADDSRFLPTIGLEGWWVIQSFGGPSGQREAGPFLTEIQAGHVRDAIASRFQNPLLLELCEPPGYRVR